MPHEWTNLNGMCIMYAIWTTCRPTKKMVVKEQEQVGVRTVYILIRRLLNRVCDGLFRFFPSQFVSYVYLKYTKIKELKYCILCVYIFSTISSRIKVANVKPISAMYLPISPIVSSNCGTKNSIEIYIIINVLRTK